MAVIIAPSYLKGRDSEEDFALEKEIPSPYFELPCTPKEAHARLATPKAT
jgi:hypothetical protein